MAMVSWQKTLTVMCDQGLWQHISLTRLLHGGRTKMNNSAENDNTRMPYILEPSNIPLEWEDRL